MCAGGHRALGAFPGAFSAGAFHAAHGPTVRNAKPRERDDRLADGGGLYRLVALPDRS